MTDTPRIPVTFEQRADNGETLSFDGYLAAVPHEDSNVSWNDGWAALQVQSVIVCADRVIVRARGLMRAGSVPSFRKAGWK